MKLRLRLLAMLAWCTFLVAKPAVSQRAIVSARDSALVGRILLAEDRRDSSSIAVRVGERHSDPRIRLLARRAAARVRVSRFAARDSFPALASPPTYGDPPWRLRFRGLVATSTDCSALRGALIDSALPVRLRAADLAGPACAADSALVGILRGWVATGATALSPAWTDRRRGAAWHAAAHGLLALARLVPDTARALLPGMATARSPSLRMYAARAAGVLGDTTALRRLAGDGDDNVKEVAIEALAKLAGHAGDDEYLAALSSRGYQAVRAAARALAGSPRASDVLLAALGTARRLRADTSETSRDARLAVLERIGEFGGVASAKEVAALTADFDCNVARSAAAIAARLGASRAAARCTALPVELPVDAIALALGREVRLLVTIADSNGGGSFTVRLRGDVAPIMAGRVLALARSGYYDGLVWHRVEPDFVIQGGSPGANEYVGHPRYIRDELGTLPHVRGTVGMSTRGHDTGDAQWFVNLRDNLRLNRDYTVFGEIVDGIDVVDRILEGDTIARIRVFTP